MLAREHRLSEKRDFQRVFTHGLRASTPLYSIHWARNTGGAPRFGFVVSNKISKHATKRNTIRRRLRECARRNLDTFPLPLDVVIVARPPLLTTPYRDLEPVLLRSFEIMRTRRKP